MRYHALCCDYDGTLAHDGALAPATIDALERVVASGRRNVLVTGPARRSAPGRGVTGAAEGAGVIELIEALLADDLARALASPRRRS